MDRNAFVLAALGPAQGEPHSPVQVQKLLFLLDRECADMLNGPHFDFEPYSYGPFDAEVYRVLEALADEGLVVIRTDGRVRNYALSPSGQAKAEDLLRSLADKATDYVRRASDFVRTKSFAALVAAIYNAYPEMRENSVFGFAK